MMRMSADQEEHTPAVFLWYANSNHISRVPLPIKEDVISREHIDKKKEHDERIAVYVERLGESDYDVSLSYTHNIKKELKAQKITKEVTQKIWEAVG